MVVTIALKLLCANALAYDGAIFITKVPDLASSRLTFPTLLANFFMLMIYCLKIYQKSLAQLSS